MHATGPMAVSNSVGCLVNLQENLPSSREMALCDNDKGKQPASARRTHGPQAREAPVLACCWEPPSGGWIKLNFDKSFLEQN
jgi:hypothetical protein